jgi:hypothetical protein
VAWGKRAVNDNEERDKSLTMNWLPAKPDMFDALRLPRLPRRKAMIARDQILAEALVAGDRWISYSRRKLTYSRPRRYVRSAFTYRSIVPVIDQLAAEGLLDNQRMPSGHRGFQSRFRASDALLRELERASVIYVPKESIILRDLNGDLIDYRDNDDTVRMRSNLAAINEVLTSQEIALAGKIIREGDRLDSGGRAIVQMHRVFNRGNFGLGGRFYGPHWQNTPSDDRAHLTIGGDKTVERDYRSMHPRLLYQEAGVEMEGDPYAIEGWPRKQVKIAMAVALNATSEIKACRAIAQEALGLSPGWLQEHFQKAKQLLDAIKAKHPGIASAFGSDAGARLMRKDSDIAERIMLDHDRARHSVPTHSRQFHCPGQQGQPAGGGNGERDRTVSERRQVHWRGSAIRSRERQGTERTRCHV